MRLLARLVVGLLLALSTSVGSMVLTAGPAAACSCAIPSIELFDELDHDVAFSGVVTKRRVSGDELIITLRTDQVFQGDVTRRMDVVSHAWGASCGLEARERDGLIVFGYLKNGEVTSDLCSTVSTKSPRYRQILAELEARAEPAADTDPSPGYTKVERDGVGLSRDQYVTGRAIFGALGLVGLGYLAYRTWRARRRTD